MSHGFDQYDKMIHGWIQKAIADNQPRQAAVVRSDGSHVFVRFVREGPDAPETKLPSAIAGLPAGTMGWVYPVAGGKEQFIPWGATPPVDRAWAAQDATTGSNSTQTMQPAGSVVLAIPIAGAWRIQAIGGFSAQHTAGVSPIVRIRIDTSGGPELFGPPAISTVWTAQVASHTATLELPQGDLTVTVEYRRGTTSGTISARNPWLNVSATKV